MFRGIVCLFGLTLVVSMPNTGNRGGDFFIHGSLKCCKKDMALPFGSFDDEFKECFQIPKEPPSCEIDLCFAKKLGFASSDGTIDKKALEERVEKDFKNNPDLAKVIKEKCVNGDISKYGKEDFCEPIKIRMCVGVQTVMSCDDWKDEGICSMVKASAQEIIKQIQ